MGRNSAPGFYGKIPNLGDFISRRLPRSFVEPWDQWLQHGISRSREQLGSQWLEAYLVSPVWRFALGAGICGSEVWVGVLMPSVDRVGRYFPLTLATALPDDTNLFDLAGGQFGARSWYEQAESLVLSVLKDEDLSIESFDHRVQKLGFAVSPGSAQRVAPVTTLARVGRTDAWRIPLQSVDTVTQLYPKMVQQLTKQRFSSHSVWWSSGSEYVDSSLLVCKGLPPTKGYAAMLAGQWLKWAWEDWQELTAERA